MAIHPPGEDELIARAVRAATNARRTPVLIREASIQKIGPRQYVLLPREGRAPLVYRIRTNGLLRILAEPPAELVAGYPQDGADDV